MARKRKPPAPDAPPVPPELVPLNDTERRFLVLYVNTENAVRCWLDIHPDTTYAAAAVAASTLLKKPNVARELKAMRADAARRCLLRADKSLRENAFIAHSDIGDLIDPDTNQLLPIRRVPLSTRRAIQSVRVRRERVTTRRTVTGRAGTTTTVDVTTHEQELEFRLYDKSPALEREFRYLGLTQAIPSLDVLLASLPAELAAQVRDAMTPKKLGI